MFIVDGPPPGCDLPHFFQTPKQIEIEHLIPIGAIKSLDKCILRRATWLNVMDQHPIRLSSFLEWLSDEFWAVIHANHVGQLAFCLQAVKDPNDSLSS